MYANCAPGPMIVGIDHVQLAMPPGREDDARGFYDRLLGIAEVPKPPALAKRGGAWFESGPVKVHVGVDTEFRPARKAHPALLVRNLRDLVRRLRDAGVSVDDAEPLARYDRVYVDDPFGNGLLKIFGDRFKAAGGGEVSAVKYPTNAADLSSEMTKVSSEVARLSASGSTAFFCACFLGDAQKALKLAVVDPNMGKVDWLGVENLYQKPMLADKDQAALLAATHFTVVSTASITNPNTQPFIDAYKAKFNKEPGPFTNFAYDAANIAMLSMLMAGNNGAAVQKVIPFVADHYIGTQVQSFLDANGDQAIAYYTIYRVKADGSDFEEIGTYDGSTGKVTFTTK